MGCKPSKKREEITQWQGGEWRGINRR